MRIRKHAVESSELALTGEVAAMVAAVAALDVDACIAHLRSLVSRPVLEIAHPLDGTPTRARSSLHLGRANVVFFADDAGGHRWLLVQMLNLVDAVVVDGVAATVIAKYRPAVRSVMGQLAADPARFEAGFTADRPFAGLIASYRTPFHFFYDFVRFLVPVAGELVAAGRGAYTLPGTVFYPLEAFGAGLHSRHADESTGLYLLSTGVQQNLVNAIGLGYSQFTAQWRNRRGGRVGRLGDPVLGPPVARAMRAMERLVRGHAVRAPAPLDVRCRDPRGFTVLVGIADDKRSWIEQADGLAALLNGYAAVFPELVVVFDGMTAEHGERTEHPRDDEAMARVREKLAPSIVTHSIVGMDYRSKIAVAEQVDFFLCDAGTAAMVPLRFCRKPGVIWSNGNVYSFPDRYDASLGVVPPASIRQAADADPKKPAFVSFHMDWRCVWNASRPMLAHAHGVALPPAGD